MNQVRNVVGDRRAPSRGDRQRARIVDAAADLLHEVPIADLSVARIAERAGVTRPAFYFYFESKYAVLAAALEQVWTEMDSATEELAGFDFGEPPREFSARMIGNAVAVWQQHAQLLNACLQARPSDPQLQALWDRFVSNLSGKLADFIDRLHAAGHVQPATDDTAALTRALVGMTVWALYEQRGKSPPMPSDRLMGAVRAVWIAAAWGTATR